MALVSSAKNLVRAARSTDAKPKNRKRKSHPLRRVSISAPLPITTAAGVADTSGCQLSRANATARRNSATGEYRVASASQLNGRSVEQALRDEQKTSAAMRSQSLRSRAHVPSSRLNDMLTRSQTAPHLTASLLPPSPPKTPPNPEERTINIKKERDQDRSDSPDVYAYSPQLSTIAEQTEPDTHAPFSLDEVLEAQSIPLIPGGFLDFEACIARFGAKATNLIASLGPLLEEYGKREMEVQREILSASCSGGEGFVGGKKGGEYFRPLLSKMFTRLAVCDINIAGDPIKLSSQGFELGSAGLKVGACEYLNLSGHGRQDLGAAMMGIGVGRGRGHSTILRTEYDALTKTARYIIHFALPIYSASSASQTTTDINITLPAFPNGSCKPQPAAPRRTREFTLTSQIDITHPLRRLALQESASASSPRGSQGVSEQMRRFLALVYWLGAFHSNVLCFARGNGGKGEWKLRVGAKHMFEDPSMNFLIDGEVGTSKKEMEYMTVRMDGDDPFVQGVICRGGVGSRFSSSSSSDGDGEGAEGREIKIEEREVEGKQYLMYCVPVTDGRGEEGEKWWVCWLVEKVVPGFWGRSEMGGEGVEYPFLV